MHLINIYSFLCLINKITKMCIRKVAQWRNINTTTIPIFCFLPTRFPYFPSRASNPANNNNSSNNKNIFITASAAGLLLFVIVQCQKRGNAAEPVMWLCNRSNETCAKFALNAAVSALTGRCKRPRQRERSVRDSANQLVTVRRQRNTLSFLLMRGDFPSRNKHR